MKRKALSQNCFGINIHGVFIFYLQAIPLTGVWTTTRLPAYMEPGRACFPCFQPKANTHLNSGFVFLSKSPPSAEARDNVLPPWRMESSSTDMAMESVVARSCGSPEVQTQRNGPNPREKMSLGREHVSLRDS